MKNIEFSLYNKNVIVILNSGEKIIGKFIEDFEEEEEILVGSTIIKYENIKNMSIAN